MTLAKTTKTAFILELLAEMNIERYNNQQQQYDIIKCAQVLYYINVSGHLFSDVLLRQQPCPDLMPDSAVSLGLMGEHEFPLPQFHLGLPFIEALNQGVLYESFNIEHKPLMLLNCILLCMCLGLP